MGCFSSLLVTEAAVESPTDMMPRSSVSKSNSMSSRVFAWSASSVEEDEDGEDVCVSKDGFSCSRSSSSAEVVVVSAASIASEVASVEVVEGNTPLERRPPIRTRRFDARRDSGAGKELLREASRRPI